MKLVYPVIFTEDPAGGYMAYVPDLEINTQGEDLAEAIAMARDAMGLVGIDMEDDGKPFPAPSQHVDCHLAVLAERCRQRGRAERLRHPASCTEAAVECLSTAKESGDRPVSALLFVIR